MEQMETQNKLNNLETDIAVMKRDINQFGVLFTKLDTTIEKISEMSNNVGRLLAVHEERLDILANMDRNLEEKIEKRKLELTGDIKELHSRITTVNRDLCDKIEETEKSLKEEIGKLTEAIKNDHREEKQLITSVEKRVELLERWKWFVVGGAVVVGWLLSKVPFLLTFTS